LSRDVIVRLERGGRRLHYTTPGCIEAALACRGVTLLNDDNGEGVRMAREIPATAESAHDEIISPAQCRAARALLDADGPAFAKVARVKRSQLYEFETGAGVFKPDTLRRLRATFVVSGIWLTNAKDFVAVQMRRPADVSSVPLELPVQGAGRGADPPSSTSE
jgi:hypothetical protein